MTHFGVTALLHVLQKQFSDDLHQWFSLFVHSCIFFFQEGIE